MLNSSPIDSWEGAGAFFNYAGSGGAVFWFWVMVVLCLVPIVVALKAESAAESEHD
ncbi:MAG: hypothetical protein KTR18_08705 [Acidiferrobacterales bacterium]|nr:hypothetical protein [Acidiferrobacterales bacterium]